MPWPGLRPILGSEARERSQPCPPSSQLPASWCIRANIRASLGSAEATDGVLHLTISDVGVGGGPGARLRPDRPQGPCRGRRRGTHLHSRVGQGTRLVVELPLDTSGGA